MQKFAIQRKIALMVAHDSILEARINQIWSANHKRQAVPFKMGDLIYVSTRNIKFLKGLARKLIPKFIGPYKILEDFKNKSFRIDLPFYITWRGVHNTFHASLLQVHVPNDDWLFPGQLDTQLGNADSTKGEWAVDKIPGHAGLMGDAVFEICWQSGDTIWLPYYQISHLAALQQYLDVLGIKKNS